jgi:transposase
MQNSSGTVNIPAEFIEVHMRKLNLSSIGTFLFLCGAAGDGSDVSLSISTIAEGVGFSRRVAIDAWKNLEEKGLLRRERKGGASANRYRLLPQDGKDKERLRRTLETMVAQGRRLESSNLAMTVHYQLQGGAAATWAACGASSRQSKRDLEIRAWLSRVRRRVRRTGLQEMFELPIGLIDERWKVGYE